jgi:predicted metal-dependent hydrolase
VGAACGAALRRRRQEIEKLMVETLPNYDPRYLAGVLLFNQGDFFEAHEAWELLWMESGAPQRRFYQGLIQAAVGLCHFGNGNVRGAVKLYRSSMDYLAPYGSGFLGLDLDGFRRQMESCFAELLAAANPDRSVQLREELLPSIALEPPPADWPDPAEFIEKEDD